MIIEKIMFLQEAPFQIDGGLSTGLAGLIAGFIALFIVIFAIFYVYLSLVYFYIGRKAKLKTPGLAWIPFVGPFIIAYQLSKMHWWPWLLLIGNLIPFVGIVTGLIFLVFVTMWHWKMFEAIRKPGWWAILMLIPIVNFILLGVAAWSKK